VEHVLAQAARTDQAVHLSDGRVLGYAEYGPATGAPLFMFHGLPGSRLAVPEMWPAEPATVRVIAPDRPGMGISTFQPGRCLTDWADDVGELADALGIRRFLVAGFSGGGPYALAVAHGLPDRVIAAGSIAGGGPTDTRDARHALRRANPANRLIFTLARKTPELLWPLIAQHAYSIKHRPAKVLAAATRARSLPEADRQAMTEPRLRDQIVMAAPEAFRQGVRGTVHDARICVQPWGFDLTTIKPPVRIWHGDRDTNVPVEVGQYLAERIPGSSLTIYPSEGHLIVPKHWGEILAELLSIDPRAT
jgi:pimeloyl-ACP methyl ester carboxylesterase